MVRNCTILDGKIVETADPDSSIHLYINPDEAERRYLIDTLKLDEHTMTSALDPNELARMEFEPQHVALITKRPKRYSAEDNFLFKVESIGLFMFSDKLVILLSEDIPIFDGRIFLKVKNIQDLLLRIIHRSVFHFEEHVKVISLCSEELEKGINTSMSNTQLLNMFTLEKSLVFYLDAISSNGRVIDKLKANAVRLGLSTDSIEFLDDLSIESAQCFEMAQNYSQVLASLMDARASIISNNLNVMMKNLNAIVIAIAIPSFFAGVGGMSEFSSFVGANHMKIAYPFFILIMMCLAVSTFFLIKFIERYWKT